MMIPKQVRFVVGLLIISLLLAGCSDTSSPRSVTKQLIDLLDEAADVLATVQDEATAREVSEELHHISVRRAELQGELDLLKKEGISRLLRNTLNRIILKKELI